MSLLIMCPTTHFTTQFTTNRKMSGLIEKVVVTRLGLHVRHGRSTSSMRHAIKWKNVKPFGKRRDSGRSCQVARRAERSDG